MMKKISYIIICVLLGSFVLSSCSNDESYAEQKEKERNAINSFLDRDPLVLLNRAGDTLVNTARINVISEDDFYAQDSMTDVSKNQYVLFEGTGLYMQIVRQGAGKRIKSGETKRIICRYFEYNILGDSLQTADNVLYWMTNPEILDVSNNSGTITASFNTTVNGGGSMYQVYKSTSVPTGWVTPLTYIKVGRQTTSDTGIAKVRLIVPHSIGQADATSNVYPCFYEITYQEMRE